MTIARNICLSIATALTLSACSYGGSDRYGSYDGYSDYADAGFYGTAQGVNCGATGYGNSGYENAGYGNARYGGGYVDNASSYGNSGVQLRKTRYGSAEYSDYGYGQYGATQGGSMGAGFMAGCGGYYMMPTYQTAQTSAAIPTVSAVTTPIATTTATTCSDGQYMMDNGNCAIMITDDEVPQYTPPTQYEPPTYVPPVSYPEIPSTPTEYYQPIRK